MTPLLDDAPCRLIGFALRDAGGSWRALTDAEASRAQSSATPDGAVELMLEAPGAEALAAIFEAPPGLQYLGGGERFETLDLAGQVVRIHLDNAGLGSGTYLPAPWIASTGGFGFLLDEGQPVIFHLATPSDPRRLRVEVEGERLRIEIHRGDLPTLHAAMTRRFGPPATPPLSFFGLWKAGDWRFENAMTVEADRAGFKAMGLPLAVKLIDAYWEDEVHSFAFDEAKYPDAWAMVAALKAEGTETWLWLCPWVVVGTRSHAFAAGRGFLIADLDGAPIVRRPGANPNIVAALIDFSNSAARAWWAESLEGLLDRGIAGFKADFGEQLPAHALLASGETGGLAHNRFVRHYLEATIDAFRGAPPAIVSRSGSVAIRQPIWSGDQTSDFCPKAGLPSAIRAAQSASLCGWSFTGSDLGGYFGTPTPQVFARWTQFACFTPLMMLHGLGCREPWDMDAASTALFARYARVHLSLLPTFLEHGGVAAAGGPPLIRMMPYAFPEMDWRGVNDWDQQFMLGDALLVAPVAFYGDMRAVTLPPGLWFDVLAREWAQGGRVVARDVPRGDIPVFVKAGSRLLLASEAEGGAATAHVFAPSGWTGTVTRDAPPAWRVTEVAIHGSGATVGGVVLKAAHDDWLGAMRIGAVDAHGGPLRIAG